MNTYDNLVDNWELSVWEKEDKKYKQFCKFKQKYHTPEFEASV